MEGPQKAKNVCKGYVLLLYYSIKYHVVLFGSVYGLCFEVSLSDISIATPALFFFFMSMCLEYLSLYVSDINPL